MSFIKNYKKRTEKKQEINTLKKEEEEMKITLLRIITKKTSL